MTAWMLDLRYGLRQLLRHPGFTLMAVLSLALAIGATTAIFGAVDTLLLRPVAGVRDPSTIVDIGRGRGGEGFDTMGYRQVRELQDGAQTLRDVFAYTPAPLNLRGAEAPRRTLGFLVTENYFEAMGVQAAAGRLFAGGESAPGANAVVVASYAAWLTHFGGSRDAIGRSVTLNGASFTLIGVLEPGFRGHIAVLAPEFYAPVSSVAQLRRGDAELLHAEHANWLLAGARLAPGATLEQANAELATIAARWRAASPDFNEDITLTVATMHRLPPEARGPLLAFSGVLFVLVGLVLLVACVNVAGMLLARGESRAREIGMRLVLGASRARVVRQLMLENVLIAALAGVAGFALAIWASTLTGLIDVPAPFPVALELDFGWHVALFGVLLTAATVLAFGQLPAWRISQRNPRSAIGGSETAPRRRTRAREALVVAQLALTLLLLVAAGLFGRALVRAQGVDPGFNADGVLVAELNLEPAGYAADGARALGERLRDALAATPGIESATLGSLQPLTLSRMSFGDVVVEGQDQPGLSPWVDVVAPDYFRTLEVPLRGRDFARSDTRDAPRVVVVNEEFARRQFGDLDPLDRTFRYGDTGQSDELRVIGVVPNGKYSALSDGEEPFLYLPASQWDRLEMHVFARTQLSPEQFAAQLRPALAALDPNIPMPEVFELSQVTAFGLLPQRIAGMVAASLGALGLLLATMGLYGVVAYWVGQRTREFGIRIALGARAALILRTVLARAARLLMIGLAIGITIALGAAQALSSLLFGVHASDALAFCGAAVVLAAVAMFAAWLPARRASRVSPIEALRHE